MKKQLVRCSFLLALVLPLLLVPLLALADTADGTLSVSNALNFRPPVSDRSVIFLGNIFGVVDGVLAGTGSQIIGAMFGVFNAAVLSLGGIILVYTLLVSTMNTAHEGEMLGKKWSSIWIPVRSVFGIGMLIPKTSGYCMMQIFVMWVVLQGVGAADKVWDKALDYLDRGGVIVQKNLDPTKSKDAASKSILQGAAGMLTGQICMRGLEHQIVTLRNQALTAQQSNSGICATASTKVFCDVDVPDLLNSVNLTDAVADTSTKMFSIDMPNFSTTSGSPQDTLYSRLNGLCGVIKWKEVPTTGLNSLNMSQNDQNVTAKSRSIAMQQMWDTLTALSGTIIGNSPALDSFTQQCTQASGQSACTDAVQKIPLGVPLTQQMTVCSSNCTEWGTTSGSASLLSGMELQMAVAGYNAVMRPTLNALKQASSGSGASQFRSLHSFSTNARSQGWIMAGAYYFKLALINNAYMGSSLTDSDSDAAVSVKQSTSGGGRADNFAIATLISSLETKGLFAQVDVGPLGKLLGNTPPPTTANEGTILTQTAQAPPQISSLPNLSSPSPTPPVSGVLANTVYGYLLNASVLQLPGEDFIQAPTFTMNFDFSPSLQTPSLPGASFSGGFMGIPGAVATLIYNVIFRFIFNLLLSIVTPLLQQVFYFLLAPPILLMSGVFTEAVKNISNPDQNPIIGLAAMGSAYINGTAALWIEMIALTVGASAIPLFGVVFVILLSLMMPLVMTWLSVMLSVGMMTAYYVPFVPFLFFTLGSIAWLIAVIEAMVAAPIVALGVTHPEGHEAFGKGEQAIMLILNVFLRPSMMIFGYIFAIILTYVSVWVMNSGFQMVMTDIQGLTIGPSNSDFSGGTNSSDWQSGSGYSGMADRSGAVKPTFGTNSQDMGQTNIVAVASGGTNKIYTMWTGTFFFFFSIILYTTSYVTFAQQSFELIYNLPDKILRWLSGGTTESFGSDAASKMGGKIEQGAQKGAEAGSKAVNQAGSAGMKLAGQAAGGEGGGGGGKESAPTSEAEGNETPDGGDTPGGDTPGGDSAGATGGPPK